MALLSTTTPSLSVLAASMTAAPAGRLSPADSFALSLTIVRNRRLLATEELLPCQFCEPDARRILLD